jgi:acyl-CoA-binding protein
MMRITAVLSMFAVGVFGADKAKFDRAAAFVRTLTPEQTSKEAKLQCYALYKQVTAGPASADTAPSDDVAKMKYDAWVALGSMPADEAMDNYIALIIENFPEWEI